MNGLYCFDCKVHYPLLGEITTMDVSGVITFPKLEPVKKQDIAENRCPTCHKEMMPDISGLVTR